ncbi:MAG: hypothetical protein Q8934_19110 [Bacillota bacterium]|nr:hypothetical protein [Bacillota bacterium]
MDQSGIQEILKALKLHSAHIDERLNETKEYFDSRINKLEDQINERFDRIEAKMNGLRVELTKTQV